METTHDNGLVTAANRRPSRSPSDAPLVPSRSATRRQPGAGQGRRRRPARQRTSPAGLRVGAPRAAALGPRGRRALVAVAVAERPGRGTAPARLAAGARAGRPGAGPARTGPRGRRRRSGLGDRPRTRRTRRRRGRVDGLGHGRSEGRHRALGRTPLRPSGAAYPRGPPIHRVHAVLARLPQRWDTGSAARHPRLAASAAGPARYLDAGGAPRRSSPTMGGGLRGGLAAGRARRPGSPGALSSAGRSPPTRRTATVPPWRGPHASRPICTGAR